MSAQREESPESGKFNLSVGRASSLSISLFQAPLKYKPLHSTYKPVLFWGYPTLQWLAEELVSGTRDIQCHLEMEESTEHVGA